MDVGSFLHGVTWQGLTTPDHCSVMPPTLQASNVTKATTNAVCQTWSVDLEIACLVLRLRQGQPAHKGLLAVHAAPIPRPIFSQPSGHLRNRWRL